MRHEWVKFQAGDSGHRVNGVPNEVHDVFDAAAAIVALSTGLVEAVTIHYAGEAPFKLTVVEVG